MTNHLLDILLPYQRAWVLDQARYKIGMWSRQTGKSFSSACDTVLSCRLNAGEPWVVLSAGERQALEWMDKAKLWAKASDLIIDSYDELRQGQSLMTQAEIKFANRARILAIPANPATARGYSANLVLDEFAVHERPQEIWAAIYPSITNPITGLKKLRILSTPKGRGNKFADLWEHNSLYSKHKVTILDAVAQGLKVNVDELRAGVDDPDIWAQEYMCEFVDSAAVLLPYDMIGLCESGSLKDPGDAPLYIGMDIGRSHDISVIVTLAEVGGILHAIDVEPLVKMPYDAQLHELVVRARAERVRKVCIDATGIGSMLAEDAVKALGGKAEAVIFSSAIKNNLFGGMRRAFEDRTIRVPVNRDLREDLHAVQRMSSSNGSISYSAPRNADGHSDRASALALAIRAATTAGTCLPARVYERTPLSAEDDRCL